MYIYTTSSPEEPLFCPSFIPKGCAGNEVSYIALTFMSIICSSPQKAY